MKKNMKAYNLLIQLRESDKDFDKLIAGELSTGKIRFFGQQEWDKIASQNFVPLVPDVADFLDMFYKGYNIGNCKGMAYSFSFSYDNVDIVSGILPMLKGTLNAEKEGGHCWLEDDKSIIDTSLMLVIDKSLRDQIGYIEEQRITSEQLKVSPGYQARKKFTNDKTISKPKTKNLIR